MAEPKKRMTSTRSGNRQSKDALCEKTLVVCTNCKHKTIPHRVCFNCGFYKGKKVIDIKSDIIKKKKVDEQLKEDKDNE